MWLGFTLGWVVGSLSLYIYIYITAREAPDEQCVECRLPECTECPCQERSAEKLAA